VDPLDPDSDPDPEHWLFGTSTYEPATVFFSPDVQQHDRGREGVRGEPGAPSTIVMSFFSRCATR
jgi:hypothetical protein